MAKLVRFVAMNAKEGAHRIAVGEAFRRLRARRGEIRTWPDPAILRADRGGAPNGDRPAGLRSDEGAAEPPRD